jgi:4-amino-4-deoxy-L-arabinose transferase-like glycosyltransferase
METKSIRTACFLFLKRHPLLVLLVLAAVIRIAYVSTLEETWYYFDTAHYDQAARSILQGEGFGSSLHFYQEYPDYCLEPVYPLFLAAIYMIFGVHLWAVRLVQVLLSVLQIWLTFRVAAEWSRRIGIAAAVFSTLYPFFIYITGLVYVTQLVTLFVTLTVYALIRYRRRPGLKWLLLSGLAMGVTVVTKPVLTPSVVLILLWILLTPPVPRLQRLGHAILFGVTIVLCMTPWALRNYIVYDTFAPGRVCVAETGALWYINTLFEREEALDRNEMGVDRFGVQVVQQEEYTSFITTLDGESFIHLYPADTLQQIMSGGIGVMFYGGAPNELDRVRAWNQADSLILDTARHPTVRSTSHISREGTRFVLAPTDSGWEEHVIFPTVDSVRHVELTYMPNDRPQNTRRLAILLGLDPVSLDADGVMIWLQPWKDVDLWAVKNGTPVYSIGTTRSYLGQYDQSIPELMLKHPVRFVTDHYIPEFLKFWSPWIDRITTQANRPSLVQQLASMIFFTPLLLLLPFGLFRLWRLDRQNLILMLIFILILSMGYSIFFAEVRYRLPIDPLVILISMAGLEQIVLWIRNRSIAGPENQDR